jgi:hypothetical protein
MYHSVPVLLFPDGIEHFSCNMPSFCPSLSPIYIMQSDQSTVCSTFNSESIDERVTNCHMFGYNKQRIGKFLCCVTPVSYAMHCKHSRWHQICTYPKLILNPIVMLSFLDKFTISSNRLPYLKFISRFATITNSITKF